MQTFKALVGAAALLAVGASAQAANSTSNSTSPGDTIVLPGTAVPYGGTRQVTVGPSNVQDLMMAMSNRTNYAKTVGRPICVVEVKKVMAQIVAGINYQFEVDGCSQTFQDTLGRCREDGCTSPARWQVNVFSQPWTNTYRVDKIQFLG